MIKFLDLELINNRYQAKFQELLNDSIRKSQYILGDNVSSFEAEFANYCGVKYCIGVASGLDALTLILKAYIHLGRLSAGDKVLVPANTFIATILSVMHADLEPVLVEPDRQTYNLSAENLESYLDQDVKAIIMVHLYGKLADISGLRDFAKNRNLLLLADAAQAHGASMEIGRAGALGDAASFSFYPSKNLGALGDGGAITTSDYELYKSLNLLRNYGSNLKYHNEIIGYNSRLDDLQAAFLRTKLPGLDVDNERRRHIALKYLNGIRNPKISLPIYDGSKNHVFYAFVIEIDNRDDLTEFLDTQNIGWLIHYPIPPHKQKALEQFSNLKLSVTEQIHKRVLSLPISPVMTDHEVETVIKVLNTY